MSIFQGWEPIHPHHNANFVFLYLQNLVSPAANTHSDSNYQEFTRSNPHLPFRERYDSLPPNGPLNSHPIAPGTYNGSGKLISVVENEDPANYTEESDVDNNTSREAVIPDTALQFSQKQVTPKTSKSFLE